MLINISSIPLNGSLKCGDIASLHFQYIDRGFLRQLGTGFLTLLYEAICRCPSSVLIVDCVDGRVIGFVSAAASMKSIYKQLLLHPFRLLASLLPSLILPSRLKR